MMGNGNQPLEWTSRGDVDVERQIANIVAQLNAFGDNPLHRREIESLRRAYTSAVVRYFNDRRSSNLELNRIES